MSAQLASHKCRKVFVNSLRGLVGPWLYASLLIGAFGVHVPAQAQRIYYPRDSEFGAPLDEQAWKELRNARRAQKSEHSAQRGPASLENSSLRKQIPARTVDLSALDLSEGAPSDPVDTAPPPPPADFVPGTPLVRGPAGILDGKDGIRTATHASSLRVAPLTLYSNIDTVRVSSGTASAAVSNFNYGAEAEWKHIFSKRASMQVGARYHRLSLRTSTDVAQQSIAQGILGLNAGVGVLVGSSIALDVRGVVSQEIFVRPNSAVSLTIDKVFVPQARGRLKVDLLTLYPFQLGAAGTGILLFPQSTVFHEIELGKGFRAEIYLEQESHWDELRWFSSLFFEQKRQNTAQVRQLRRDFGLEVGFYWGEIP